MQPRGVQPENNSEEGEDAVTATAIAVSAALSLSVGEASAQGRFDVGLLLGTTWATDEGAVLQFYTGSRNFSISTPGPRVDNVIGSGGLVVRF